MSTTLSFAGQNNKWNTAEDATSAAATIKNAQILRCLQLEGNTLGVEAARVMGDALADHPEFERAHWKDLFTGRLKTEIPDALRHLFSGLMRAGAKLKELDLSDNALGPVGVEGMVDFMCSPVCYSLQELRLNNNGLGIKGGTMLANSLMKLVENAKAAGSPLKLKVFISGRNRLEKEGAKEFSKFFQAIGSLEEVAMPQNGIFHEGIAALAQAFSTNPGLKIINLNDNTFTHRGARSMAKHLPSMQNLEVINFGDCLIRTAGAQHIAKAIADQHLKLKELHLDSNEIEVEGGLQIANAMTNKDNLTTLNLDYNQFGEEGRECIVIVLQEIARLDALATLENDEDPDGSDDEDDEDGDEDEDEEDDDDEEEEDEVQELQPSGTSPLKRSEAKVTPVKCTAAEFYEQATPGRLLGLGNSGPQQLVEEARRRGDGCQEEYITACFSLLMRVSAFATVNNTNVQEEVKRSSVELCKAAFSGSDDSFCSSLPTNTLLVHLGLIKCENKKFHVDYDLRGCLLTLADLVRQPLFPRTTRDTLQLFLSKPNTRIDTLTQEKHKLMVSLFQ